MNATTAAHVDAGTPNHAWLHVQYLIVLCVGSISLIGSSFIMITWLWHKSLRTASTLLIFCLAVSDFMFVGKFVATAVLELAHDHAAATAGTPLCTFFGLVGQFAGVAATAWNAMLAVNLWLMMQYPFRYRARKWVWVFQLYVWGLATTTSAIIFADGAIGASGDTTCWIKGARNLLRMLFFVPLLVHWSLCIAVLLHLYCGRAANDALADTRHKAAKRVARFVVVFVVLWTPESALRTVEYGAESLGPVWLQVLTTSVVATIGISNASVWLFTLRNLWKRDKAKQLQAQAHHSTGTRRPMRAARRGHTQQARRGGATESPQLAKPLLAPEEVALVMRSPAAP